MVKEPGQYPQLVIRVSLTTKNDWKQFQNVQNARDRDDDQTSSNVVRRRSARRAVGKSNYNLTILTIRSDGTCFDMRHTKCVCCISSLLPDQLSAWLFDEQMSSFVVECEMKDPRHKIEVYAGGEYIIMGSMETS